MTRSVPTFDGHNDALLRMFLQSEGNPIADFIEGTTYGHLDLKRARAGHLFGGLFAVFVPPNTPFDMSAMANAQYDLPLPPPVDMEDARRVTIAQISLLQRLEREAPDRFAICRTAAEIRAVQTRGAMAAVLHIEGVECLDADLQFLDVLHAAGLRSLGPVWSRNNIFGDGVPFRFPGSPDTGGGLTNAGQDLVRACNQLGILVDLSHMTEKGFDDVARLSNAPLVASHSNVHALCPSPRNLTDRQLDIIRASNGLVGLNFSTSFLRADGRSNAETSLDILVDHVEALLYRVGEDGVGLGSDFDGALMPSGIGDAAGLQNLFDAMRKRGYSEALIKKIASGNWLSVLERTIG